MTDGFRVVEVGVLLLPCYFALFSLIIVVIILMKTRSELWECRDLLPAYHRSDQDDATDYGSQGLGFESRQPRR